MSVELDKNNGVVRLSLGKPVIKSIAIPALEDGYILVKTDVVALNPTDYTTIDAKGDDGTLVGNEYSGTVVKVGRGVKKPFKPGDRVAGFAHGANDMKPWSGAFARYIVAKGDLQLRIPDKISQSDAATLPVGLLTTGLALYEVLGLPLPGTALNAAEREPILIYGGSTAVGSIAVQFANISGYEVYTTCSSKHFEMMRQRGVKHVYDYRNADVGEQIHKDSHGKIKLVLDCVAIESSEAICAAAFGFDGGIYCNLLGIESSRKDVKAEFFLGYSVTGEEYIFEGEHYDAEPKAFGFMKSFTEIAEKLWFEAKIKLHPARLQDGGLRGTITGMEAMRQGKGPSGEKWVYRVEDTK